LRPGPAETGFEGQIAGNIQARIREFPTPYQGIRFPESGKSRLNFGSRTRAARAASASRGAGW
jgi:hypothetical protein